MKNENEKFYRVNHLIKLSPVVVIDQNGKNLGPVPLMAARGLAEEARLDLVEISPGSRPPVCRIMDFGKFKFEQSIKDKKLRKKQSKISQVKEIHLSPGIQGHDIDTKLKSTVKFLGSGHKVNVKLEFKRREMAHQNIGMKVMNAFVESLKEHGTPVSNPKMDGRNIFCVLSPKEQK